MSQGWYVLWCLIYFRTQIPFPLRINFVYKQMISSPGLAAYTGYNWEFIHIHISQCDYVIRRTTTAFHLVSFMLKLYLHCYIHLLEMTLLRYYIQISFHLYGRLSTVISAPPFIIPLVRYGPCDWIVISTSTASNATRNSPSYLSYRMKRRTLICTCVCLYIVRLSLHEFGSSVWYYLRMIENDTQFTQVNFRNVSQTKAVNN